MSSYEWGSRIHISKNIDEYKLHPYASRLPLEYSNNTLRFNIEIQGPASWVLNAAPHQSSRQQVPPLLSNKESQCLTTDGNHSTSLRNGLVVNIIVENSAGMNAMQPFHKHNHKA